MSIWKPEYEGFPRGFFVWMWELHRVGFLVSTALLILGVGLLVLAPFIALAFALLV